MNKENEHINHKQRYILSGYNDYLKALDRKYKQDDEFGHDGGFKWDM